MPARKPSGISIPPSSWLSEDPGTTPETTERAVRRSAAPEEATMACPLGPGDEPPEDRYPHGCSARLQRARGDGGDRPSGRRWRWRLPPRPVEIGLLHCVEKKESDAREPLGRPPYRPPMPWAQSSTTVTPCRAAIASRASRSADSPNVFWARMTRVRRADRGLDRDRIDRVGGGVDVDIDRSGARVQDRVRNGDTGEGGQDHFVAATDVERSKDRVERDATPGKEGHPVGRDPKRGADLRSEQVTTPGCHSSAP